MSRTFNDSLQNDLEAVFFNTDEFASGVTIRRGTKSTANVAAIVAMRSYDSVPDDHSGGQNDQLTTAVQSIDFDIIATKYVINGVQVEPRQGDQITNAAGERFQVMPIVNKQCFEPTADGKVLRIHTTRVS